MVNQIKTAIGDRILSQDMMEPIETVLLYKFKDLSRQEIEAMFTLSDLKETKVYQEAFEEGKLEGELKGKLENARQIARNMINSGIAVEQVVRFTGLTVEQVRQL